ncbi:MAG: hydrogenase iron-sulfur subunit [Promethearchaeota archaeon]
MSKSDPSKKEIICFACKECGNGAIQTSGIQRLEYSPAIKVIRVECSGLVGPIQIMDALKNGADSVAVIGCCLGACHYFNGNYLSMHRIKLMKKLFKENGYSDQFINHYTARAGEGETVIDDFTDIITRLEIAQNEGGTFP